MRGLTVRMMIYKATTVMTAAAAMAMTATVVPPAAPATAGTAAPSAPATHVTIQDVQVPVPGQPPVPAYLVRPAGALPQGSQAGILFLHWLGQIHGDRTEFLGEAIQLAQRGAVSLLPQGVFPWQVAPTGTPRDVTAVEQQAAAFQACLDWLIKRSYVSQSRIAVVGHDYGAMYGALIANDDPRVHAAVLATPDATWGHWFVKYWLGFQGSRAAHYRALFRALNPVTQVSRLGTHQLFQWAGNDIFVSAAVRERFARAAPSSPADLFPDADHQLTTKAETARDAFLAAQLHLSS